ncbi:hypothetical protein E4U17_007438 [Claviceps sp. LM77 group G4]|nr:hypothetical protein E4U17_007438 [Claviceps sp. LM77 group G4]KAG6079428.1 hypothetical protein E4U16_001049 [Claviceps sp. LM84 group G4]KAG6080691.1 hypothetical protein E4U33_007400 [Claviceps sp. LM78 group G4]
MEKCMADFLAWNGGFLTHPHSFALTAIFARLQQLLLIKHVEDRPLSQWIIDRRSANLTYERDEIKAKQRGIVCGTRVAASQEQTSRAALIDVSRLPKDFPISLESDVAWDDTQFKSDADYIVYLTEEHLREIDVALDDFKKLGLDGDLVHRNNFQLPTLEGDLNHLRHEIHDGKGFGLIRGLEPQRYSVEDLTTIYLGLQSYIADLQGRQDKKGNMLGE